MSRLSVCIAIIALWTLPLTGALGQTATLTGVNLHVPVMNLGDASYLIDLTLIDDDPVQLQLSGAQLLSSAASAEPSQFINNRLHIPELAVAGVRYAIDLDLVSTEPVILQLAGAEVLPETTGNVSMEEALVVDSSFDADIAPIGYDSRWSLMDDTGDKMLCNLASTDWTQLYLGNSAWENYAIEVQIQQLNNGQGFEFYLRLNNSDGSGFRAALYNSNFMDISHFPAGTDFPGVSTDLALNTWVKLRAEVAGSRLRMYLDDILKLDVQIDSAIAYNTAGLTGIGVAPDTSICLDNVRIWAIDESGPIARDNLAHATDPNDPRSPYEGECYFCFLSSRPNAPVWDARLGGYVPAPTDTREQIVLDQTFQVNAGETVEFSDKIIWVRPTDRGPIEVFGTLRLRNSLLIWDQTQHQQTRLNVNNGGTIDFADTVAVNGNAYWVNWDYQSGSTIIFDNFVGDPWTSLHGASSYTSRNFSTVRMTLFDNLNNATVNISDAHHVWLELFLPPGTHHLVYPEKLRWLDWNMNGLWPNSTVTLSDSYIYERDITITQGLHATLHDTPSGFSLGWIVQNDNPQSPAINCELAGLGDPLDNSGVLYEDKTWDLTECMNASLTLKNSRLQRAWPATNGHANLVIRNSNLVDIRNYGSGDGFPASMEIYDSTLELLAAYNGSRVYIENSAISTDIEVKDAGTKIYGYNITWRSGEGSVPVAEIDGGSYVQQSSAGRPW